MNKYFEIKPDCALYKAYFAHKEDEPKIVSAFKEVCEKFGIETKEFYMKKDRFWIIPNVNDRKKFAGMMKKTNDGEFKKNSEVSKMWIGLVKDIEHFENRSCFITLIYSVIDGKKDYSTLEISSIAPLRVMEKYQRRILQSK